jgi:hypothetical protein
VTREHRPHPEGRARAAAGKKWASRGGETPSTSPPRLAPRFNRHAGARDSGRLSIRGAARSDDVPD